MKNHIHLKTKYFILKYKKKNIKINIDVIKLNLITDINIIKILNNIIKSITKWSLQNIDTLLNPLKEQVIVLLDKHISLKKKKLDLKIFFQLTSTLKTNIIVYCTVNKNLKKKQNVIYLQEKVIIWNFILFLI